MLNDCIYVVYAGYVEVTRTSESDLAESDAIPKFGYFGHKPLMTGEQSREQYIVPSSGAELVVISRALYDQLGSMLTNELIDDVKYKSLRRLAPGGSVSDDQIHSLLPEFTNMKKVPSGTTVVEMGSTDGSLYLILKGKVSIQHVAGTICSRYTHQHFGEESFITSEPSTVRVTAATELEYIQLTKYDFKCTAPSPSILSPPSSTAPGTPPQTV
eukprot:scaffold2752_cov393-Prasinococcus_capsulatus_cf.AAC.17